MAGTWIEHTVQVPASSYLMQPSSLATTVPVGYVAGAVKYKVFVPDPNALIAAGISGQPYRVLCVMPPNSTGDFATFPTCGAQIARNLAAGSAGVGLKLGYGANDDGSLQTANTTWPYLVVFPQFTTDWDSTDPALPGAGTRKQRAWDMIVDAIMPDVASRYTINPLKTCLTSVSSGGSGAFSYLAGRSMRKTGYNWDFASAIIVASWFGVVNKTHFPDVGSSAENYDLVTAPRMSLLMHNIHQPIYMVVSQGDGTITPAFYNSTINNLITDYAATGPTVIPGNTPRNEWSGEGGKLTILEYQTGGATAAPNHGPDWDWAYGNNVLGGPMVYTDPMWVWMEGQQFSGGGNLALQSTSNNWP